MRGLGLIGLLLAAGIIFYMMFGGPGKSSYVRTQLEAKEKAETQVNAISGKDEHGDDVTQSIKYEVQSKGVLVTSVIAGGAFDKKLGLKAGDLIVGIGPMTADQFGGSPSDAKAYMQSQFARPDEWTVMRAGKKIELPRDRNVAAVTPGTPTPAPTAAAPEAPTEPAAPPVQRTNPRKQALDIVKQVESH